MSKPSSEVEILGVETSNTWYCRTCPSIVGNAFLGGEGSIEGPQHQLCLPSTPVRCLRRERAAMLTIDEETSNTSEFDPVMFSCFRCGRRRFPHKGPANSSAESGVQESWSHRAFVTNDSKRSAALTNFLLCRLPPVAKTPPRAVPRTPSIYPEQPIHTVF